MGQVDLFVEKKVNARKTEVVLSPTHFEVRVRVLTTKLILLVVYNTVIG